MRVKGYVVMRSCVPGCLPEGYFYVETARERGELIREQMAEDRELGIDGYYDWVSAWQMCEDNGVPQTMEELERLLDA